jgi:A/G-specific adenine glycosylase
MMKTTKPLAPKPIRHFRIAKPTKLLSSRTIRNLQEVIYAHYRAHGRHELPWRKARNPYRVLVSEFMLQQTQVPRVIGKYESFLRRFPNFESLARAPLRDVLKAWSGLGYNRRGLHLRETARVVVSEYGGKLPADLDRLRSFPGVGRATASAVAAFAFGRAHPFIETNIRAVFIYHFFGRRKRVSDEEILPFVEQTLDHGDPRTWFYALMDYGVALKKNYPNPSRKSAHHTRQGKFEGSDRQARGMIVRALVERSLSEGELAEATGLSPASLRGLVQQLEKDAMIVTRRGKLHIA